jgi:hypothetical protein
MAEEIESEFSIFRCESNLSVGLPKERDLGPIQLRKKLGKRFREDFASEKFRSG